MPTINRNVIVRPVTENNIPVFTNDNRIKDNGISINDVNKKNFTELNDTPTSYTGQAEKLLSVKSDETGLEFSTVTTKSIADYIVTNESELNAALSQIQSYQKIITVGTIPLNNAVYIPNKEGIKIVIAGSIIRPKNDHAFVFDWTSNAYNQSIEGGTFKFYTGQCTASGNVITLVTQDREFVTDEWAGYYIMTGVLYTRKVYQITGNTSNTITVSGTVAEQGFYTIIPQNLYHFMYFKHRYLVGGSIRGIKFLDNYGGHIYMNQSSSPYAALDSSIIKDCEFWRSTYSIYGSLIRTRIHDNIYLFPDYDNKTTQLYPSRAIIDINGTDWKYGNEIMRNRFLRWTWYGGTPIGYGIYYTDSGPRHIVVKDNNFWNETTTNRFNYCFYTTGLSGATIATNTYYREKNPFTNLVDTGNIHVYRNDQLG